MRENLRAFCETATWTMQTIKMKKLPKSSELMWLLGIILVALGVCLCKKADLGVSMIAAPTFIIYEAIAPFWSGFSVGMVEYLVQGAVLILLCVVVQKFNWRYLLAFLVAVIYGYVLDLWLLIFGAQPFQEIYLRWIMLFVGDFITALGVACFFRTYMPLQVYELFVAEIASRFKKPVNKTKMCFDLGCLVVSVVLAFSLFGDVKTFDWSSIWTNSFHSIGLGTLITTLINAPIVAFSGKILDKLFDYTPLFPRLKTVLERKSFDYGEAVENAFTEESANAKDKGLSADDISIDDNKERVADKTANGKAERMSADGAAEVCTISPHNEEEAIAKLDKEDDGGSKN